MGLRLQAIALIILTLFTITSRAESVLLRDGGLDEDTAATLTIRLRDYYRKGSSTLGRFDLLVPDRYHGLEVIPYILSAVLSNAREPGASAQRRHRRLLAWAAHLGMMAGPTETIDELGLHIQRQLHQLLQVFYYPGDARNAIETIFSKVKLWGPAQLPYLARRAGGRNAADAQWYGEEARMIMPDGEPQLTAEMVKVIREQRGPRHPVQWAMLAQSGHITDNELATILVLVAHAFAREVEPLDLDLLRPGEPLRDVVQELMTSYADDDEVAVNAFQMARDESEAVANIDTPLEIRRSFFQYFADGSLFTRSEVQPWRDEAATVDVAAATTAAVPAPEPVERFTTDGNVIKISFPRAAHPCSDEFTKP